jgi:hypothetical protein
MFDFTNCKACEGEYHKLKAILRNAERGQNIIEILQESGLTLDLINLYEYVIHMECDKQRGTKGRCKMLLRSRRLTEWSC